MYIYRTYLFIFFNIFLRAVDTTIGFKSKLKGLSNKHFTKCKSPASEPLNNSALPP